jgi:SAM-dependent methyltransferase
VFTQSAALYDLIYSRLKNYPQEARDLAALLRSLDPGCRTVLDVACGTGEHAHLLAADHGFQVDGIDLDPVFVRLASAKHAAGRFYQADMTDFHLGRQYDAVVCLFSSIGYLRTVAAVQQALECFREHLAAGGVVIVEPWFTPDVMEQGHPTTTTVEAQGLRIVRSSHTEIEGRLSRIRFDYEIHDPGGVRRASEVHELGLFTTDEMLGAFAAAGLRAEHRSPGLAGRGLFIASAVA